MGVLECGVGAAGKNGVAGGVSTRLESEGTIKLAMVLWSRLCGDNDPAAVTELLPSLTDRKPPDAMDSWPFVIELFELPWTDVVVVVVVFSCSSVL